MNEENGSSTHRDELFEPRLNRTMLDDNPDVSALLKRVMSKAPEPSRDNAPKTLEPVDGKDSPDIGDTQKWWLPGICGQTRVTTNFGQVPAHLLRVGDRVKTRSGGYLKIRRIRETKLDCQFIEKRNDARPVMIPQGSLGQGQPEQHVLLSPAQEVFVTAGGISPHVLRARDLSQSSAAVDMTLGMVGYFEIHLDEQDDVCCEGIWVRSVA